MAIATVTAASVVVGSFDCSPFTGTIASTPGEVSTVDITTLGSGGFTQMAPAIKSGTFTFDGYADHAVTTGISTAFTSAAPGTQYSTFVSLPGTTAGDFAVVGRGIAARRSFGTDPNSAPTFALELSTDTAFAAGKLLAPLASRTTSGLTGTAVALTGPTASQSLYATLNVTAASGTNLVVKVQSDDNANFTSATDRITFSTVSATGWQWSSVAGDLSTETHWRVVATIASGTFTFGVAVGVA